MDDNNWFDEWWESVKSTWGKLGIQWKAVAHYGTYMPPSGRWKFWHVNISKGTCIFCLAKWWKIYASSEKPELEIPVHPNCKCQILPVSAIKAGTATIWGYDGADWHLRTYGDLPDYYVTKKEAREAGWQSWKGNLADVLPGISIGGNIYHNRDGKLPSAPGRVWYEADINYTSGHRGLGRIVYSNDGLIFVTYDHFTTFIEIV